MSEQGPASPEDAEEEAPREPRLRVVKGRPWRIDAGRRRKWSDEAFVREHALEIRQIGDPVLHAPAKRPGIGRADLEALVARLFASMVAAQGVGIAAPQVGIPLRVAIMDVDEAGIVAVEPVVESASEEREETTEGCLSVRGFYGTILRPSRARIAALDVGGRRFAVEGEGLGAQCLLHETDHLGGVLYVQHLRSREDLVPVEPDETEEVSA